MIDNVKRQPLTATAVIVLFGTSPEASLTVRTFLEARRGFSRGEGTIEVIIWDNSPQAQPADRIPPEVKYIHDPRNLGLANAYNRALEAAIEQGSQWLITLDQDTEIPNEFLSRMAEALQEANQYAGVGAIVPLIFTGEDQVSPNRFLLGAIPRWHRRGESGTPRDRVFAFNSGAMISVGALRQVGGYSPWFWLDNSDSQIFRSLHRHGKRVLVATKIELQHNFALKDIENAMNAERYRSALLSDSAFYDSEMNWLAGCERTARLALRWIRQLKRRESREKRLISWDGFKRRLLTSRRERLDEWSMVTKQRLGSDFKSCASKVKDKRVSVCMAAYNEEKQIVQQLHSVLDQLGDEDEVVVIDDGSQDQTVRRIEEVHDPRVRLLRHGANLGVMRTFEDALRCATGQFLFLCDEDDIWPAGKIKQFLRAFEETPEAGIVISQVRLMDKHGCEKVNPQFVRRFERGFWRNLIRNNYQGSAMALRATFLERVLPFPQSSSFLHDAWIGTRADLLGVKTVFIEEDLLRRPSHSTTHHRSMMSRAKARLELLMAHGSYMLRHTAH